MAEWKVLIHDRLPAYMTPAVFVALKSMPLTAGGKLDRRALPAPGAMEDTSGLEHVAPSTELERLLASLWAGALGVTRVSTADNFFDLGGHSLLAMQIMSRLCEALEMDVSLRALFDTPSLAACAAAIAVEGDDEESVERRAARFNEHPRLAAGFRA
jgi:acyl carrier protein